MAGNKDVNARQVELIGPVAGAAVYLIAAGLVLAGPLTALIGDSGALGLGIGIFTFPFGVLIAVNVYEWRRTERRFQAVGVAATAEIFAVNEIRSGGEERDTALVSVRISTPGSDTFTAQCEISVGRPLPRAGDRPNVMVDPSDNSFAVGYDHLFWKRDF